MVKLTKAAQLLALGVIFPLSMTASGIAAANPVACVDGSSANNLTATWNGSDTFTVMTKTGAPLCNDVTLYGSSYVLTDPSYAGGTFGAPGSYPQTLYKSVTATLKAGTNGMVQDSTYHKVPTSVVVPLSPCGNQQVDLYYGPEKTTVDAAGHGSQYIAGNIITPFNPNSCEGGKGGVTPPATTTGTTPTTPTPTPVVAPAATAAVTPTLSDTGVNIRFTSVLAAALLAAAAYVFTRRQKVSE